MESLSDQNHRYTHRVGGREAKIWGAALAFVGGLFLWRLWVYRGALIDDAYISLRYGRHWMDGLGLVFNGGERVEGYTNFLWVIVGGLFHRLPIDPMWGLRVLSLAAAITMIVLSARLLASLGELAAQDSAGKGRLGVVGLLVGLLAVESLAYYATTGMESMFFAGLFTLALFLVCGERSLLPGEAMQGRFSALCFVLLSLTRPEGVLLFGLCHGVLWSVDWLWRRPEVWRQCRRSVVDGLLFSLLYGLYFAWRWDYFGEIFPNTYYAKVTGGPEQWWNGWLAFRSWGASHPLWIAVLVLTPILLWRGRGRRDAPLAAVLWGTSVCWLVYVVTIGGDFMPFFRFLLPLVGAMAVLTMWCGHHLPWPVSGPRRAVLGLALILGQVLAGAWDEENLRAYVAHRTTVVGQEVGRFFASELPPETLMAVNTVGSLPYESGLPTIDMLGLTDKAIARHPIYVISPRWAGHRRGWGEYVFGRRPRVVLWYNSAGAADPHYLGDHQLADHPLFRFFYQAKHQVLPPSASSYGWTSFSGAPLGESGAAPLWLAELGAEVTTTNGWLGRRTRVEEAPIQLHYFELRSDLEALWPYTESGGLELFLEQAVQHWLREMPPPQPVDEEAVRAVDALCRQALAALEQGRREAAKELLGRAIQHNGKVRSPLPYQYVANLAYLDGSLFLAVHAQLEALRLAPRNRLYRNNLKSLLEKPFDDYRAEVAARSGSSAADFLAADSPDGGSPKQPASRQ